MNSIFRKISLTFLLIFTLPSLALSAGQTTKAYLDFKKIVDEGSGSKGIDVRKDGKIVNYKANDWFCIDAGKSVGDNASMQIKLKRKSGSSGYVKVTRLKHDGTTLAKINTTNISRNKYEWTDVVKLGRTSQKVICFVLRGARIQIENIALIRENDRPVIDNNPDPDGDDNGGGIEHIGTNVKYDKGDIDIETVSGTKPGDLLLLFVHRTDGPVLKKSFDGWNFLVKCEKHPTNFGKNNVHCNYNDKNTDLGQTIFYRKANFSGKRKYEIDMSGSKPTWAMLTTLRNAATSNPMRDSAVRGCDNDSDSIFPSVDGKRGDLLVMSQSFDDKVSKDKFKAPSGTSLRGYINGSDETGFLYTKPLTQDGKTKEHETQGSGASKCKDALISLTIRDK